MAYCSKCGESIGDNAQFCSACGMPASINDHQPESKNEQSSSKLTPNVAAALAYLGFLLTGIIFLVVEPYRNDRFIKFHAFQSILFTAVLIAIEIVWNNVSLMFVIEFGRLYPFFKMIDSLIFLAAFLFWLYLMHKAYNNENYRIPVIGSMASKQAEK
jgi:uncharacterized membrane protein